VDLIPVRFGGATTETMLAGMNRGRLESDARTVRIQQFEPRRSDMAKFKEGDIVQLKSGGPKMTVSSIEGPEMTLSSIHTSASTEDRPLYHCRWFAGSKLQDGNFSESVLQAPGPSEKKTGKK
jgi:uncharacterized protein YodC (DUF2158 family)